MENTMGQRNLNSGLLGYSREDYEECPEEMLEDEKNEKTMAIIEPDNKIKNIQLTGDEITIIIEDLERAPHVTYKFFNYKGIIKKLKNAKRSEQ